MAAAAAAMRLNPRFTATTTTDKLRLRGYQDHLHVKNLNFVNYTQIRSGSLNPNFNQFGLGFVCCCCNSSSSSCCVSAVRSKRFEAFPNIRGKRVLLESVISKRAILPVLKNRKICCFRKEDFGAEDSKPEVVEGNLVDGLVTPEIDHPKVAKKDWSSRVREGADAVYRAFGDRWSVPWTGETILQVMLLWIASFWFVGSWMMPFAAHMAGFSKASLTYRGQALYSLLTDVAEGVAGIAILHRCISRFRPLPPGWFKLSLKGNWLIDVALGCLMFPLVNRLSQFNLDLLPLLPSTPVTLSSVEQSILARDPVAMGLYAMVVSVCAPIWEEVVFRGFLLPSLTKYMPVWSSILVSSVVFALAHFNVQRMLPLILLGVVMGALFARSRNLVPSILLHSLWNAFVFLDLMK